MVFAIPHTPPRANSTLVVNHHEKRVETEVRQLVDDIRRIKPEGELHCHFGDLFSDPQVEQFYEALVGTLKAAKKKGLIQFKGQILLKGMHDQVRVSIAHHDNNNNANGIDRDCNDRGDVMNTTGKGSSSANFKTTQQTPVPYKRRHAVTKNSQTQTSTSATKQTLLTPTKFKGQKMAVPPPVQYTPPSASYSKHGDDASMHSFATAPTPTIRSLIPSSMQKNDVLHSKATGSIFNSNSIAETHEERVHREVHQLVTDIQRIEPEGEKYCAFGDLFDDELVEQYYEALVGTLRAAKRKGLIKFKGQMLFKGMHDGVQIDISP